MDDASPTTQDAAYTLMTLGWPVRPDGDAMERWRIGDLVLTQAEMAQGLGLALRSYHGLENGDAAYRPIHILAAERLTLAHAAQKRDPRLFAAPVQGDLRDLMDQWHLVVA